MTETSALKISWQRSLLIFTAVLLLAVPQAALLPLIDRDEPRFAEAAREMIQSGNFVVPTFNGVPRYDKPPLIYWCEAAAYEVFGENAFAARLPSLVATAATAVLIFTWGVRLGREWIGLNAALAYALCLQTMQQGRVATADALLIFFMTLTALAGWLILRPKNGRCAPLTCYVILTLGFAGGFLAKGPEAWLPLLPLLVLGNGVRSRVLASFLVGCGLVLLWGVPAYVETNGAFLTQSWKAGIADRAWGSDQGHGASNLGVYLLELPYYVVLFWACALPWSGLILFRARRLLRACTVDFAETYLLLNIVPLVVIFTFMATKLPHYTLPAFPMIALLVARRWVAAKLSPSLPLRLIGGFGIVFALATLVAVPLAVENGFSPSPVGDLVRAAGDSLTPDTQFALVDFKEPTAVWEMRGVTKAYAQILPEQDLAAYLAQPGPRAVVLSSALWQKQHGTPDPTWRVVTARGLNTAKGTPLDLTLVLKPR